MKAMWRRWRNHPQEHRDGRARRCDARADRPRLPGGTRNRIGSVVGASQPGSQAWSGRRHPVASPPRSSVIRFMHCPSCWRSEARYLRREEMRNCSFATNVSERKSRIHARFLTNESWARRRFLWRWMRDRIGQCDDVLSRMRTQRSGIAAAPHERSIRRMPQAETRVHTPRLPIPPGAMVRAAASSRAHTQSATPGDAVRTRS